MNTIAMGILIFTLISLLFGALFGRMRGRNRAILRLALIVLSVVLAILLRGVIVDTIMGINVGDGTIKESMSSAFGKDLPESMQSLIFALIEIMIGLVAFFILFIMLQFVTWILVFPILKIFVKKGENKRKGAGALVGLAQGLVIAFVICAPLTGILVQVNKLASIEMNGEPLVPLPEELGISEFVNSAPGKVYNATGGWFFNVVSSTKDEDGNKVSIDDTCDIVVTVVGIADTVTGLAESMEAMTAEDATPQDRINALRAMGDSLEKIGSSVDGLSKDAKNMIDGLIDSVKDMITSGGNGDVPPALENALNNFKVDDLKLASAGRAMKGIASYIETVELGGTGEVTQKDINNIVNGLADNKLILDIISSASDGNNVSALIEIEQSYADGFNTAISNTSLDADDKALLRQLFGLTD